MLLKIKELRKERLIMWDRETKTFFDSHFKSVLVLAFRLYPLFVCVSITEKLNISPGISIMKLFAKVDASDK